MTGERSYQLEPLDTSGIFVGLGAVQCALVGGGLTLAVVAISAGLPITGASLDRASAAALAETGGGEVTGTEVGDEESRYEVEVAVDDGTQVDGSFKVVSTESDGAGGDDDD